MPSRRCLPTLLPATGVPCCWHQRLPSSTCAVMMRRKPAISLGIDYKTPTSWLRSLWELLGDGRGFVDNLQRQMLFSDMIDRRDDAALQPLSRSQGTVRMLSRMARDVLPGVAGTGAERCRGDACSARAQKRRRGSRVRAFACLRGRFGPSRYGRALRGSRHYGRCPGR